MSGHVREVFPRVQTGRNDETDKFHHRLPTADRTSPVALLNAHPHVVAVSSESVALTSPPRAYAQIHFHRDGHQDAGSVHGM